MTHQLIEIIEGARNCVVKVANVQKGDRVLIFTDTAVDPLIAHTLAAVAKEVGGEVAIMTLPFETAEASEVGGTMPAHVVEAARASQIVLSPTSYPLQHTLSLRGMAPHDDQPPMERTWINIPPPHFINLSCDGARRVPSSVILKLRSRTIEKMKKGKTYRMTTESGTDITTQQDLTTPGGTVAVPVPFGRFSVFPVGVLNPPGYPHKDGNGSLVVDFVDCFPGTLSQPIRYTIKDGHAVKVEGGYEADWIRREMERVGFEHSSPWWEFSMGMNPCIPINRNNFEALKVHWHALAHRTAGVVHIAVGIDPYFHLHGTILEPTITCLETGEKIVDKGVLAALSDEDVQEEMKASGVTPSRW